MNATRTFYPPCSSTVRYSFPFLGKQVYQFYFVPTRPGYCLVIWKFYSPISAKPSRLTSITSKINKFLLSRCHWSSFNDLQIAHTHNSNIHLDQQDIAAMYPSMLEMERRQEQKSQSSGQQIQIRQQQQSWKNNYFLPTKSDVGVFTFRQWLDKYSAGHVPYFGSRKLPKLTIEQLTDRWHSHSKDCIHCSKSYDISSKWIRLTRNLAILSSGAAVLCSSIRKVWLTALFLTFTGCSLVVKEYFENLKNALVTTIPRDKPPSIRLGYKDFDRLKSL